MVGTVLATTTLAGCSLFGLGEDEPLACQGETPPSSGPGDAQVLLTMSQGDTRWDLTTVIYTDGSVALTDGAAADPGVAPTWHTGYLLPCALDEVRSLAEDALFGGPDFGEVARSDSSWTWVHYDNGALKALAQVYGFQSGYTDGLDWSQRRAREDLRDLTDFLEVNIVSTGDGLPVETVQVDAGADAPAAQDSDADSSEDDDAAADRIDVPEVAGWPGPPLADLLGQQGCGVVDDQEAQALYEFATGPGLGSAADGLNLRVLPPGVPGCA